MAVAACLALAGRAAAQVSADALLDKLVAKGILRQDEAEQLKNESLTNNAAGASNGRGMKFKIGKVIKDMELYGDVRMRYEYRAAQLAHEAGAYAGAFDTADRWRFSVRLGVRGDLVNDDFYYGLRLETAQNERSPWVTFGSGGSSPYNGPFSKSGDVIYLGQAYLGWRPASWLDVSVGKVPQPLYTTSMVWDSDITPEGLVEKLSFRSGPADIFATLGQFIYQDVTPTSAAAIEGGNGNSSSYWLGNYSDQNAYLLAWQLGLTYHMDTNVSFKVAPVFYQYVGHGNASAGFYGPFVGQGINGFTFNPIGQPESGTTTPITATSSSLPGAYVSGIPGFTSLSYNQTGINNLAIVEIPMEVNFKLWSLDAKAFGDFSINLEGDDRSRAAYTAYPSAFPHGLILNQDQAMQFGLAVGNNLGLVYGTTSKRGTWEARAYWQHVEQYALDPNLLDSDFFEGRGNLQGLYTAFAYSFTDATIGSLRYGVAERINSQLGTGGYNADLPLPNPINRFQVMQADLTLRF
jgi:hypothetical protein